MIYPESMTLSRQLKTCWRVAKRGVRSARYIATGVRVNAHSRCLLISLFPCWTKIVGWQKKSSEVQPLPAKTDATSFETGSLFKSNLPTTMCGSPGLARERSLALSGFSGAVRGCFSAFCLVAGTMSMRAAWCPAGWRCWRHGSAGVGWFTRLMRSHWAWSPRSAVWLLHLLETAMTDGGFLAIGWS